MMISAQFKLKSVPHVVDLLPPATGCNPAIHLNASFNSAPIAAGLWQEARRGGSPHEYDGLIYFRKSKSATKIGGRNSPFRISSQASTTSGLVFTRVRHVASR